MTRGEIAEQVRVLLLAHPDVIALYSAQPLVTDIALRTLPAIVPTLATPQPVRVGSAGPVTTVSVLVGLDGQRSAALVCRELHDLIVADLNGRGVCGPLTVSVTVSSVA